jgi:hypothetical protein
LWSTTTNTLRLQTIIGGVSTFQQATDPGIVAGTQYTMRVEYTATDCRLYIDNVLTITTTPGAGIDFGANIPNMFYAGSNNAGEGQLDAVFG